MTDAIVEQTAEVLRDQDAEDNDALRPWIDLPDHLRKEYRDDVRRVLAALRDVRLTDVMVERGAKALRDVVVAGTGVSETTWQDYVPEARAALTAALTEDGA